MMACVGISTYFTVTTVPVYEARAKLFVSTPASFFDANSLSIGSNFGQQRVKSYAQIVNSPINLEPVISDLKLAESSLELAKSITAIAPADTVLIEIIVHDPNPARASAIANAVGKQFEITVAAVEVGTGATSPISAKMVEGAVTPGSPVLPRKKLNLLGGLFFGFTLGFLLSIIKLLLENKVKNEGDLEGTKLFAAVLFEPGINDDLLASMENAFSFRAETYRLLRTNVVNALGVKPKPRGRTTPGTILVTSAHSAEGKSTTCVSLAYSLTNSGHKVLLVELDLRRPSLGKLLGGTLKSQGTLDFGLTEYLNGKCPLKSAIKSTHSKGLSVITSGRIPNNPSELIASTLTENTFNKIITGFDYVIFDSPPLLAVNDALTVAPLFDQVLMVIKAGTTRITHYRRTLRILSDIEVTLSGVVLNMIPEAKAGEDYGYGYGIKYGYSRKSSKYGGYLTEYIPQEEYKSEQL